MFYSGSIFYANNTIIKHNFDKKHSHYLLLYHIFLLLCKLVDYFLNYRHYLVIVYAFENDTKRRNIIILVTNSTKNFNTKETKV